MGGSTLVDFKLLEVLPFFVARFDASAVVSLLVSRLVVHRSFDSGSRISVRFA